MKIIGHRGAAGLAPENTIKSIKAGIAAGADAVEIDIRLSSDGVFVLSHDSSLLRIAGSPDRIKDLSSSEIRNIDTFNGETIPTLEEALKTCAKTKVILEAKGIDWAKPLADALKKHRLGLNVGVIAFNHAELVAFHKLLASVPCYALESRHAFSAISLAHAAGLRGVDLKFWLLNPFTYWYARLMNLDIIIYTIDRPILMRYYKYFYPKVAITTNYPNVLKKIISRRK